MFIIIYSNKNMKGLQCKSKTSPKDMHKGKEGKGKNRSMKISPTGNKSCAVLVEVVVTDPTHWVVGEVPKKLWDKSSEHQIYWVFTYSGLYLPRYLPWGRELHTERGNVVDPGMFWQSSICPIMH